jgi:cyclophilin family peptidyl-prolyl cis-trans isomerase
MKSTSAEHVGFRRIKPIAAPTNFHGAIAALRAVVICAAKTLEFPLITMKLLVKLTAVAAASLVLTACFHTQLRGSVGGAQVTIAALRTPNNILANKASMDPADWIETSGQAQWDAWSSRTRLLVVGTTRFEDALPSLDPDALYVVAAAGGEDYDPDSRKSLSDSPKAVQGRWHAIATGQRITDGNLKVSALTEALYQQQLAVVGEMSDAAIQDRLDAAAQLVVGDADGNGTVDYDDVLRWNRSTDAKLYRGRLADLDALADAISSGQPADMLVDLSRGVLGSHRVEMVFDAGTVLVETYNWDAPITVANFLGYVESGFYDQVLVHRAIENFMIQIGMVSFDGLNEEGQITWSIKPAGPSIVNEASNGLSNVRASLSMARTSDPNSASFQFFINQVNNTFLDYGSSGNPDGYAVFGAVYSGMPVVDAIAAENTVRVSGIGDDVPARGVILESVRLL